MDDQPRSFRIVVRLIGFAGRVSTARRFSGRLSIQKQAVAGAFVLWEMRNFLGVT
jgi:hypothetical protein